MYIPLFFIRKLFTHLCFDHCHRTLIAPYVSVDNFILDPQVWNFKTAKGGQVDAKAKNKFGNPRALGWEK